MSTKVYCHGFYFSESEAIRKSLGRGITVEDTTGFHADGVMIVHVRVRHIFLGTLPNASVPDNVILYPDPERTDDISDKYPNRVSGDESNLKPVIAAIEKRRKGR